MRTVRRQLRCARCSKRYDADVELNRDGSERPAFGAQRNRLCEACQAKPPAQPTHEPTGMTMHVLGSGCRCFPPGMVVTLGFGDGLHRVARVVAHDAHGTEFELLREARRPA